MLSRLKPFCSIKFKPNHTDLHSLVPGVSSCLSAKLDLTFRSENILHSEVSQASHPAGACLHHSLVFLPAGCNDPLVTAQSETTLYPEPHTPSEQ